MMRFWPFSKLKKKCNHEFDYLKEMTKRDERGMVSCRCHKCGITFVADCGLNLPGELVQLKDAP